ncbi:MAG: hypothetical protein KC505_03420 [Myxococcales bacterium]|nr:hypothetical protein [Myxococcales bacterium]USN50715.1 MAG: hypothetical protein H6731_10735 [Myxococcales bacterium]
MKKLIFFITCFSFYSICGETPHKNIASALVIKPSMAVQPQGPDLPGMLAELIRYIDDNENLSDSRYEQFLSQANNADFILALEYLFNNYFISGYEFSSDWLLTHFEKMAKINWEKAFELWKIQFNKIQNIQNVLIMNANKDFSPIDATLTFADSLLNESLKNGFTAPLYFLKEFGGRLCSLVRNYSFFEISDDEQRIDFPKTIYGRLSMFNNESGEMLVDAFISLFYQRDSIAYSGLGDQLQQIWKESSEQFKEKVRRNLEELDDWEPSFY